MAGREVQPLACLLLLALTSLSAAQDALGSVCAHEFYDNVDRTGRQIREGETIYRDIRYNMTHRYIYQNQDVVTMNQPDQYRKVIINLEPCRGVVYLFVRKTRRCWPNPYSCIDLRPGFERREASNCEWTHFMSEIDGSRDGAPTYFEVPLSSTKFFISVYSPTEYSAYTLTILADIGRWPRPGAFGRLTARCLSQK
ncbi:unnamed protein product [Symbiodinium natans]|uniref:Uncharacterized protein n=1 Tax=Symbiodinium natans TaxID=878477 RepID=A0A812JP37_9DINO|nr:unnamed protein product [Symbiodinium natans]